MALPLMTSQRERGVNPGGRPSGPRLPSPEGSRKRNTLANLMSKGNNFQNPGGMAALPALSPAETANLFAQRAGLAAQYQMQRANIRAQRVGLNADFSAERAGIVLERKRGIADVESTALESGTVGSSMQATGITDVRAGARTQLAAAKSTQLEGRQMLALQKQQAGLDYYMAGTALEAQALASQQEALAQQFMQDLIVTGKEPTMDVLKKLYETQLAATGGAPGAPGGGRRRPLRRPSLMTAAREGGGY